MRLRVLTWNIHKGIGGVDRRYRPERIIDVIAHYAPDLVLLQEVDDSARRSRFHRQVDLLGDALDLRHRSYGPNVRLRRGRYGNATLSRWPLTDTRNINLTLPPKKRRGVLYVRCRVRRGRHSRTVAVFNLHLGLVGFERKIQLRRFLGSHPFAQFHDRTPIILGGDFNDLYGTLGPKLLEPVGFRPAGQSVNTYPAVLPVRALDGLYLRGDLASARCFRSRLKLTRDASDHLPLVADLEIHWRRSTAG
ncbi:MAG: endonuclease/exonuclease/phosphatase family protein [Planctomycetota bacterium]|jgi:endonuclease/exonuclease/phosphatase family metal-dependent hydrolase